MSLITDLGDPDALRRFQAHRELLRMGHDAVESLCRVLKSNSGAVARRAAEILADIDDPRCIPCLIEAAHTSDPILRQKVIIVLGGLSDERVLATLCDALHDKLELVRVSAAQALSKIGNKLAVDCLLDALAGARGETFTFTIIEALGALDDPAAIPAIRQHLDSSNYHIRTRAERALNRLEHFSDTTSDGLM